MTDKPLDRRRINELDRLINQIQPLVEWSALAIADKLAQVGMTIGSAQKDNLTDEQLAFERKVRRHFDGDFRLVFQNGMYALEQAADREYLAAQGQVLPVLERLMEFVRRVERGESTRELTKELGKDGQVWTFDDAMAHLKNELDMGTMSREKREQLWEELRNMLSDFATRILFTPEEDAMIKRFCEEQLREYEEREIHRRELDELQERHKNREYRK